MTKKLIVTAILFSIAFSVQLAFAQPPEQPQDGAAHGHGAFTFQDNSISYWYGNSFREPFVNNGKNIAKNVIEFTHVDIGNKLGDNFFSVQYLMSNRSDPASQQIYHDNTAVGAKDAYFTVYHDVMLNRIANTKRFEFGPIKDVFITVGGHFNTKNSDFGAQRRSPMIGPGVAFKVPHHGFLKLNAMWTKEWNEEGTDITSLNPITHGPATWGKRVVYDSSYVITAGWSYPFKVRMAPFSFEGWGYFGGEKGHTAGTLIPYQPQVPVQYMGTKPETILHPKLMYNLGSLFGERHVYQIGFGYEYWNNKFGVDHHKAPGALANTPFGELTIHL